MPSAPTDLTNLPVFLLNIQHSPPAQLRSATLSNGLMPSGLADNNYTLYVTRDLYLAMSATPCMFCGKGGRASLEYWKEDQEDTTNPFNEWYFCVEHGERIRKGLGQFFADLMTKNGA